MPHYFDHAATTPLDPIIKTALIESFDHWHNLNAEYTSEGPTHDCYTEAITSARTCLMTDEHSQLIWTSSATEANNLAIKGIFHQYQHSQLPILASPIDHSSITQCLKDIHKYHRARIDWLPLDDTGMVCLTGLETKLKAGALMVSIAAVHSETGHISPLQEIRSLTHQYGALLHIDAVQALGKIPLDLATWQPDFMSLSAHKCYGPKGSGLLYVALPSQRTIRPLLSGKGGQLQRPGTPALAQIIGMSATLKRSFHYLKQHPNIVKQSHYLTQQLTNIGCTLIGNTCKVPHIHYVSFNRPTLSKKSLLERFLLSQGSACHRGGRSQTLDHVATSIINDTSVYRICIDGNTSQHSINELISYVNAFN